MADEIVKPVYRTGESVGRIIESNLAVAAQPVEAAPPTPESPAPVPVNEQPTPEAAPVVEIPQVDAPAPAAQDSSVSSFTIPDFDAPVEETPSASPANIDWRQAIKNADIKELLKEIGVSEFAIEINEHLKNGGDAMDYLNAKAVDYNKVSDTEILKADLKKQYPSFTSAQIDLMFNRKYSVSEDASDEDKEFAELQVKADAHNARQAKITEQQKFKIPTAAPQVDNSAAQAAQEQQIEAARQWYNNHEATKSLESSKRVTLNLGDNGNFNFDVDRPELLTKVITDGPTWQKLTLNKQGEPDVAKMQKIGLYAINPEKFEADLVNYGKSLALATLIKEGQNVSPQAKVIPVQGENKSEKDKWRTEARSSTIGGR